MTIIRRAIADFQLANPIYTGATVDFFTVDADGEKTETLAALYAAPTGATQVTNPQTLDAEGKFSAPVYTEVPVIAEVVGPNVESHTTGIIQLRGTWRGNWVTGTLYFSTDFVRAPGTGSIYIVADDYVSGASVEADIAALHLILVLEGSVDDGPLPEPLQVTTASATIADDVIVAAVVRNAPVNTDLQLGSVHDRDNKPLFVFDWSTSVTDHTINCIAAGGQTVMKVASFPIRSNAFGLAGARLNPSTTLNGWWIAP